MQKISSKDASALLKQAGSGILSLLKENGVLKQKLAAREREDRIEKLAREMEEKGLSAELDFDEKVAALRRKSDLGSTEEAIKMAAPQGNILGDVGELPGVGQSAFEGFILTGEDPR